MHKRYVVTVLKKSLHAIEKILNAHKFYAQASHEDAGELENDIGNCYGIEQSST